MQILRDIQAIQAMPAGELRGLIQQSAEQLLSQFEPGEYALKELGRYLVVEPGDALAAIEEALGFAILSNRWDGTRWMGNRKRELLEVRMHDLRHSMASNMVNSGRSIYEVAKVLGHTQLKTSQRYSHLSQETLLAAVHAAAHATGTNWSAAQAGKAGDNLAQTRV